MLQGEKIHLICIYVFLTLDICVYAFVCVCVYGCSGCSSKLHFAESSRNVFLLPVVWTPKTPIMHHHNPKFISPFKSEGGLCFARYPSYCPNGEKTQKCLPYTHTHATLIVITSQLVPPPVEGQRLIYQGFTSQRFHTSREKGGRPRAMGRRWRRKPGAIGRQR